MAIKRPLNLKKWIDDNRNLLKPPVGNKEIYIDSGDFIVMVVGGPNARKDYHFNNTEEFFYQLEGDISIKIQEEGKSVEIPIKEGDIFLLPANVPHSPIRPANTVGLVIEYKRKPEHTDGLIWYCDKCNHKLHDAYFPLKSIENDFIPRFKEFYASEELLTCDKCGHVMEIDLRFV